MVQEGLIFGMKIHWTKAPWSSPLKKLLNSTYRVAIIGGGASGCVCAYFLQKAGIEVTIFDKGTQLRTLLPTGGGRCNLAHAEYDFKELAKNYPRGEKFLYSVFSKFSTFDTLTLFDELGIETYTQEDNRIFPTSNSAKDVREKILGKLKNVNFAKEEVVRVEKIDSGFKIVSNKNTSTTSARLSTISSTPTKNKECEYLFSHVIVAIGGHSGFEFLKNFDINIIEPKPSLVGLNSQENTKDISGIVVKNAFCNGMSDDLLFTHFGISGPLAYKISAIKARDKFPYKLNINLYPQEINLQEILNNNPHKDVKNILSKFIPLGLIKHLIGDVAEIKAHKINGKTRDLILDKIHNFSLTITGTNKGEETVTAGGIDLKEINPKTMELKKHKNLYCIGEALDIDGFCGGYNLQNAWSTAFIAAEEIVNKA